MKKRTVIHVYSLGTISLSWILACSTVFFPCFSTTAILIQFWIFFFPTSTLTSSPRSANPHYCNRCPLLFFSPSFIHPYNTPNPSYALCFYISNYICMFY
jgi:hypothetical protein